jgi:cytochrome b subunit of formate dehydrogenase
MLLLVAASTSMHAQEAGSDDCLVCHEEAGEAFSESIHGELGFTCADCHADLDGLDEFPHDAPLEKVECGLCHTDVQEAYEESLHGYALERGNPAAPNCGSCHGVHDILPGEDPRSRTHASRRTAVCADCHGDAGLRTTDPLVTLPQTVGTFGESVHGQAQNGKAASCIHCHGVHDLRGPLDPDSRIHPFNVAATCGACHKEIRETFDRSIHGRALAAGLHDSPTCSSCHGEHLILSPDNPEARTYGAKIAAETCGVCHNRQEMIAKYSLESDAVDSYEDSYHGWAVQRNYESAATCISCHTAHAVLPAEHPDSTVHSANVEGTCKQCHPRADSRFAASYDHRAASVASNPVIRLLRNVYILLIVVVIGGMVIHNLILMNYFIVERLRAESRRPGLRRLDVAQLVQHLLLTFGFVMLVITGFALRFPDAWWVHYLGALGMTEPRRANTHRVFGVLLLVVGMWHVVYVTLQRRGRGEIRAMFPARRDLREAIGNLRFHTWLSKEPVKFGRYDYTQKLEYWALIWGTALMAVTGLVLWYPAIAVRGFPAWIVAASQTIHYYEAWLATLAILVWHFFFVIFHPDQYPMSWTWLTGRMTKDHVQHHHRGWYDDEIDSPGTAPKQPSPPPVDDTPGG